MGLFLGIDVSTQSVKCIVIDIQNGKIAAESAVNYGKDLPHYDSPSGFLPNKDVTVRHADPMMWVDALELALARLQQNSPRMMAAIKSISGTAQQHGSVYLAADFPHYEKNKSLSEQLRGILSRQTSPIWMDRSTENICREMNGKVGNMLVEKTGSPAIERFAGSQIRKFFLASPELYKRTKHIHLISSFMASLLCGKSTAIDTGDGAGMNLLDLETCQWHREICQLTAPELLAKLPEVATGMSIAGELDGYFTRFGLSEGIPVNVWTGDNPGSLVGTGCFAAGISGISLGTSDTFFAPMEKFHTDPEHCGHVFGNPAGGFMSLICFSNGSLAREKILQEHGIDWPECEKLMRQSSVDDKSGLMLPYFEAESTPLVLKPQVVRNYKNYDTAQDIRAILESQMLSMRLHTLWQGGDIQKLRLTGGGSKSQAICQIAADVFDAEIERIQVSNSAGLGGAMLAAASVGGVPLKELAEMFCKGEIAALPDKENVKSCRDKLEKYRVFEKRFLDTLM